MIIQVHQHGIDHSDALETHAKASVDVLADRFTGRITRVDVYIEDVNAHKGGGADKRCLMEAHVAGLTNLVGEARGEDAYQVVSDAASKLLHAIEHRVERANAHVVDRTKSA